MEKKYIVYDIPSRKVGLSILEDIDDDELEEILRDRKACNRSGR